MNSNVYIHAWDNGTPDALSLSTERHPHDPECKAHIGRINVCNGNYGRTDWQGVARSFRRANGFVISATALLNDYYLDGASQSQRLYTMCHEQGHAYGLPHTDTNHRNADLGNCLDYTVTYSNNLMPGQINYDRLFQLYGSVNSNASTASSEEDHRNRRPQHPENEPAQGTKLCRRKVQRSCHVFGYLDSFGMHATICQ